MTPFEIELAFYHATVVAMWCAAAPGYLSPEAPVWYTWAALLDNTVPVGAQDARPVCPN